MEVKGVNTMNSAEDEVKKEPRKEISPRGDRPFRKENSNKRNPSELCIVCICKAIQQPVAPLVPSPPYGAQERIELFLFTMYKMNIKFCLKLFSIFVGQ